MNAFEQFLTSRCGWITAKDLPELIELHRLCQCVVRCGGCRFQCAAQDVDHLTKCVRAGGDYVRDVSIAPREVLEAPNWRPDPPAVLPAAARARLQAKVAELRTPHPSHHRQDFNEADCGGVFDGFQVTSDADPGL